VEQLARAWEPAALRSGKPCAAWSRKAREEHPEPGGLPPGTDRETAIELYSVREVSRDGARLAVQGISEKTLEKMEALLRAQEKIVAEEDLVSYSKSDFDFTPASTPLRQRDPSGDAGKHQAESTPDRMHITPILTDLFHDHEMIVHALRLRDPCSPRSPSVSTTKGF